MRRLTALLAALALAFATGCGGSDSGDGGGGGNGGGGGDDPAQVFDASCGSCHTLAAAETDGAFGPNLDEVAPSADAVLAAIDEGPGTMPGGLLEGAEAQAVADYIAENAGS